jgi:hypothetical protein
LQDTKLRAIKFFAAEVRRIRLVRIDQNSADAGAPKHGSGKRSSEATAHDDDISVSHFGALRKQVPAAGCYAEESIRDIDSMSYP